MSGKYVPPKRIVGSAYNRNIRRGRSPPPSSPTATSPVVRKYVPKSSGRYLKTPSPPPNRRGRCEEERQCSVIARSTGRPCAKAVGEYSSGGLPLCSAHKELDCERKYTEYKIICDGLWDYDPLDFPSYDEAKLRSIKNRSLKCAYDRSEFTRYCKSGKEDSGHSYAVNKMEYLSKRAKDELQRRLK